ncbi:MAG: L-serine ammonia-lyase, iron-sulfur-dependent, subunit alpha [Pirellula sp.]|nr:L-serine ammonia-lyase, iron-sulfur-dependent, subunit alpha [Pirellula sp.]
MNPTTTTPVSIFNDVIGPVMRGPSSSHCAAALRIGRLARDLMNGSITSVLLEFDRNGSLPTTHDSQGSDMGLFGGLLGWNADDERLPESDAHLSDAGIEIRFETVDVGDPHPNTYRLRLKNDQEEHSMIAISTGGGMIEVIEIDGFKLSMLGDYRETLVVMRPSGSFDDNELMNGILTNLTCDEVLLHKSGDLVLIQIKARNFWEESELHKLNLLGTVVSIRRLDCVLPVMSYRGMQVPFRTCNELVKFAEDKDLKLWELAVEYECARGNLSREKVVEQMIDIVRILRRSIASGIAGNSYDDRVLGHQSGKFQERWQQGKLLGGNMLNRMVLYVTSLMEVKSSMGVIVAAPTAGACAALPGAVIAVAEELDSSEEQMAHAMLAAGLIGVFITGQWTFAAEVGGCQAEGGAAACMAGAALVTLSQGSLKQSLAASSLAFQSMLGLICDPIANRVEAPCLGKNVMAASNALCCANMALADFDPLIPLDEVIWAAKDVASKMPREHRCTSLGGLAITPTSLKIEQKLNLKKAKCGSGCGCAIAPATSPKIQVKS